MSKIKKRFYINNESQWAQYHKKTNINKHSVKIVPFSEWPENWKTISFKFYPRLDKIDLSRKIGLISEPLGSALLKRKSERDYKEEIIDKKTLSQLLFYSIGVIPEKNVKWNNTRRVYPSAGARYPLEIYLCLNNINDIKSGLYYYSPSGHELTLLRLDNKIQAKIFRITHQLWIKKSNIVFIISAIVGRSSIKYSDRAYRYCLIESGHIGQNIYLVSKSLGLKACSVGGFVDNEINKLINVDDDVEVPLYLVAIGN